MTEEACAGKLQAGFCEEGAPHLGAPLLDAPLGNWGRLLDKRAGLFRAAGKYV